MLAAGVRQEEGIEGQDITTYSFSPFFLHLAINQAPCFRFTAYSTVFGMLVNWACRKQCPYTFASFKRAFATSTRQNAAATPQSATTVDTARTRNIGIIAHIDAVGYVRAINLN